MEERAWKLDNELFLLMEKHNNAYYFRFFVLHHNLKDYNYTMLSQGNWDSPHLAFEEARDLLLFLFHFRVGVDGIEEVDYNELIDDIEQNQSK